VVRVDGSWTAVPCLHNPVLLISQEETCEEGDDPEESSIIRNGGRRNAGLRPPLPSAEANFSFYLRYFDDSIGYAVKAAAFIPGPYGPIIAIIWIPGPFWEFYLAKLKANNMTICGARIVLTADLSDAYFRFLR